MISDGGTVFVDIFFLIIEIYWMQKSLDVLSSTSMIFLFYFIRIIIGKKHIIIGIEFNFTAHPNQNKVDPRRVNNESSIKYDSKKKWSSCTSVLPNTCA